MKRIIAVFSFLLFSFLGASAQNIDAAIARYANEFGQERMYLHLDKSSYAPGETVWFKAYLMKAIFPSEDSKTIYVDWTDDKGNLLLHGVSPVQEAITFGQFDLPQNYQGKFIHVKAYTKWMLNFDSSFLYNKDIRILQNSKGPAAKIQIVPEIAFFPEGGDVITGVVNKIAFKANDQFGRPIKLKGVIQNNKKEVVDSLRIIHDGMGFFFVNPKSGESFSAKWKDEKGADHITQLPDVKTT
ncbi:MAG: hypothetical protein ABJA32_11960, partial [Ginsengibacter sp.]